MTEERASPAQSAVLDVRIEQIAAEAVRLLGVDVVLDQATDAVLSQFEDCDLFAMKASSDADDIFIELSLPIANALIHYATSRHQMADAKSWLHREWPFLADAQDPTSTLAALTLMHIVNEGWRRYRTDPDKRDIWMRIQQRVEKFNTAHTEAA